MPQSLLERGEWVGGVVTTLPQDEALSQTAGAILCAQCHTRITLREYSLERAGAHVHEVVNPMQIHFRIGCFRHAHGDVQGEPVLAHTWFPGYAWQVFLCTACQQHLGWYYQQTDDGFFGLIYAHLHMADTH